MRSEAPLSLKPGMRHVIQAGEQISIADENNEELVIEARDDDLVLDFLRAFDNMRTLRLSSEPVHIDLIRATEEAQEAAFLALPNRVLKELPSMAARCVTLPG